MEANEPLTFQSLIINRLIKRPHWLLGNQVVWVFLLVGSSYINLFIDLSGDNGLYVVILMLSMFFNSGDKFW